MSYIFSVEMSNSSNRTRAQIKIEKWLAYSIKYKIVKSELVKWLELRLDQWISLAHRLMV